MQKDVDGFLKELSELSLKYQISIGGCGCCGSPYLISTDGDTEINGLQHDELQWKEDHYEIKSIYETPDELKP